MIHVYSLQVNALQDLNALSDVTRDILSSYGHEDPLEHGKHWGMIQNEHVKRRKATRPPPPAAAPAAPKPSSTTQEPSQKESDQETTSKPPPPQQKSEGKPEKPAPQRKKGDLFSSFAKTKPKAKTESAAGAESVSASQVNSCCF
jgi:DNA polymerase delta subunit 3